MIEGNISRRQFVAGGVMLAAASALGMLTGCTASGSGAAVGAASGSGSAGSAASGASEPITMVWLPDNSSADLTSSRQAIGDAIKAACGRDAELMTTTDYNVAIEAIASGKAQMALLGPRGTSRRTRRTTPSRPRSRTATRRAAWRALAITAASAC